MIDEMEPNREIEFWRKKSIEFEYLYHQQRKIAEEQKAKLDELIIKKKEPTRCF